MKHLHLLFFTFFIVSVFSQNDNAFNSFGKNYNSLINHIPTKNVFIKTEEYKSLANKYYLNTIASLSTFIYIFDTTKLSVHKKKWLINRISNLANGLYLDGKKILINKVGGYSGCPSKMLDTIILNNIKIIDLKFCHSCTDWSKNSFFIKIFNNKMYELMNIKPPDYSTRKFDGEFINKKEKSDFKRLTLNQDRTFKLWVFSKNKEVVQEGIWENDKNILNLNLPKNGTIKFLLKKGKLISIDGKKIKFKKINTI